MTGIFPTDKRYQRLTGGDATRPQGRSLECSGQKSGAEIVGTTLTQGLAERDLTGQVLIFAAQAIGHPGTQAGSNEGVGSGMPFQHRSAVAGITAVH